MQIKQHQERKGIDDLQPADLPDLHFSKIGQYVKEANLEVKKGPGSYKQNLATLTAYLNGVYILNLNASKCNDKM